MIDIDEKFEQEYREWVVRQQFELSTLIPRRERRRRVNLMMKRRVAAPLRRRADSCLGDILGEVEDGNGSTAS